jgi:hypothetical protein
MEEQILRRKKNSLKAGLFSEPSAAPCCTEQGWLLEKKDEDSTLKKSLYLRKLFATSIRRQFIQNDHKIDSFV